MEENKITVGQKEFLSYIRSLEFFFIKQRKKEVTLSARGQNIKKAIDLAEASKNKFLENIDIKIKDVKISTTKFVDNEGIERSVSVIDIKLVSN